MSTVREFIRQSYRLISAANPTQALHGDDLSLGITVLNQLLQSYASTGLLITVPKQVQLAVIAGQGTISTGDATVTPTPDLTVGRLSNLNDAWVESDDVDYPLMQILNSQFNSSFKYSPLTGLPRYVIVQPAIETTNLILYPAPSKAYTLNVRAKFQLSTLTSNDNMSIIPDYYKRYLLFALAKDIAMYKGRAEAWTGTLEQMLTDAKYVMESASEINLDIKRSDTANLNGADRLRSGL